MKTRMTWEDWFRLGLATLMVVGTAIFGAGILSIPTTANAQFQTQLQAQLQAQAQVQAQSQGHAPAQGKYCVDSALAGNTHDGPEPIMTMIRGKCQVGDTLYVPAVEVAVIARACDFNRSMMNNGRAVVCVYAGDRGTRR